MTCPVCRTPTVWDNNHWRPFCSERCQLTDLGTWATGGYRIPGTPLTVDPEKPVDEEPDSPRTGSLTQNR